MMAAQTIRAVRVHGYGGPGQLKFERIKCPAPQAGEVLLRVHAAGVNAIDWKIRQGLMKDFQPITFPYIPGIEVAGVVEAVGPGVTMFEVDQAVFGWSVKGAYAEYVTVSTDLLAPKPETLNFVEAATVPVGATTAWRALFEHGGLAAGQRVLIQGAAGGVGVFAVQLAKWKGAQVLGTASTANLDVVRSLGTDVVIDYTTTPVESVVHNVDLVVNGVGGETFNNSLDALRPGGTLIAIAGSPPQEEAKAKGVRAMMIHSQPSRELLQILARLIDEGQLKAVVGKTFLLREAQLAHEYDQRGHGRGRIVLQIADERENTSIRCRTLQDRLSPRNDVGPALRAQVPA